MDTLIVKATELDNQILELNNRIRSELTYKETATEGRRQRVAEQLNLILSDMKVLDPQRTLQWIDAPERKAKWQQDKNDGADYEHRLNFAMHWGGGGRDD